MIKIKIKVSDRIQILTKYFFTKKFEKFKKYNRKMQFLLTLCQTKSIANKNNHLIHTEKNIIYINLFFE